MMKLKYLIDRKYYKHLFSKLKKKKWLDIIFLDLLTLLISIVFIVINIALYFPTKIGLYFPNLEIEIYVIEKLLSTLSIFIGIAFSLIILSFNFFNKYFGRLAFLNFFGNRSIKRLFTLFVVTIAFLLYTLSYLKEIDTSNRYSDSLLILSIFFCLVTVFGVFPVAINLLKKSHDRGHILGLIKELNTNWLLSIYENKIWNDDPIKHSEKDPVTLLLELGTVAIKEYDYATIEVIIKGANHHIQNSIITNKKATTVDTKQLYQTFNELFSKLFHIAAKERNEAVMLQLAQNRFDIEKELINDKENWNIADYKDKYRGWSFNFEYKNLFNKAIQYDEDEVCRRIIENYRDFISQIIKVILPKQNFDYDLNDRLKNMDEVSMFSNFFSVVDYFLDKINSQRKFHLFKEISNIYLTNDLIALESENTHNTKLFLLSMINNSKLEIFQKYIEHTNIKEVAYLFYPFQGINTQAISKLNSDIPFKGCLKAIDLLFANEKLNSVVINLLKADIFHFLKDPSKNRAYITLAINKFNKLRSSITRYDNDYKKDLYIKLERYLTYIQKEAATKDTGISKHIDNILKKFIFTQKFKKELDRKGFISSDRIT